MSDTKVSVIMPVYNGEKFLEESILSILNQTFKDFEFLLIDDGSVDQSMEIIRKFNDNRIRIIQNKTNQGLALVRNIGLKEAKGEYIAWLDCDDISLPTRLEKQVRFLDNKPQIGLCGTWIQLIGLEDKKELHYPVDPEILRCSMLFYDPVATSSIMVRRSNLKQFQLDFNPSFPPAEDYDFWERFSSYYKISNIPEVLTLYRIHKNQASTVLSDNQKYAVWEIQKRQLSLLKIVPNDEEKMIHLQIGIEWFYSGTDIAVLRSKNWLEKLATSNLHHRVFPEPFFSDLLAEKWKNSCYGATLKGRFIWKTFKGSPLFVKSKINSLTQLHFIFNSLYTKCLSIFNISLK